MKTKILFALFALAFTLGVGCKKENEQPKKQAQSELKQEQQKKSQNFSIFANSTVDEGYGGYPGGQYVYPHSTGLCYCGQYSVCHPQKHKPICKMGQEIPGTGTGGGGGIQYGCTCLE